MNCVYYLQVLYVFQEYNKTTAVRPTKSVTMSVLYDFKNFDTVSSFAGIMEEDNKRNMENC